MPPFLNCLLHFFWFHPFGQILKSLIQNPYKIEFLHCFISKCNVSYIEKPTNQIFTNFSPRLWSRSQLQQIVNCLLHFVLWKTNSPKTFCLKSVSPSFSCLIVTCVITKSKKQNIHICKMVQDYYHKLSTFPQLFVTSFSIQVNNISWKFCVPFQIQAELCFWSIS